MGIDQNLHSAFLNPLPITLHPITRENWKQCITLAVNEAQQGFVPSNLYSIAEAQFYPDAFPLAIYHGDEMVGFVMYGRDLFSGHWKIFRLMIDAGHQGKGYGRAALLQVIQALRQQPDVHLLLICCHDTNHTARGFYASLGFVEQSVDTDGKVTAVLNLTPR